MNRRAFVAAGLSIAGGVVAGGALAGCALPTDVRNPDNERAVIHGTPFTVDVKVVQNSGAPVPSGTPIRGRRFEIRGARVTVTTGRNLSRHTRAYRI